MSDHEIDTELLAEIGQESFHTVDAGFADDFGDEEYTQETPKVAKRARNVIRCTRVVPATRPVSQ